MSTSAATANTAATLARAKADAVEAAAAIARLQQLLETAEADAAAIDRESQPLVAERDALKRQVEAVEARIEAVHKTTAKYATVQDPVIANDGFTYERATITAYINDCRKSGVAARSNQADMELTDEHLYSNSTLRRIVDQLRAIQHPNASAAAATGGNNSRPPQQPQPSHPPQPGGSQFRANAPPFGAQPGTSHQHQFQQRPPAYPANRPPVNSYQLSHHQHSNAAPRGMQPLAPPPPPQQQQQQGPPPGNIPTFRVTNPNSVEVRHLSGNTHPCMRVYGQCNFGDNCAYAKYPIECCLSNLKSRCRYGDQCKELHVEVATVASPPQGASSQQQQQPPTPPSQGASTTSREPGGVNPSASPWQPSGGGIFS
uniref:C3H1-type domain-containing protein n=1 Tax=Neobodo designis TaxID=312471 RepID=A0A7S1VZG8_NEODS|mmetsp:Transcript_47057/g.145089  ORF Transcript_47057/g.145089 Transcript_47057/m.145089 type:complete len:372 (+) Transcript_47057:128-1243(+)